MIRFLFLGLICLVSAKAECCICFSSPIEAYFKKDRTIILAKLLERTDYSVLYKLSGVRINEVKSINYQYKFEVLKSCKKGEIQILDVIDVYEVWEDCGLLVPHFARIGDTLLLCANVGGLWQNLPKRRVHGNGCNLVRILNQDTSLYAQLDSSMHYYLDHAFQLKEDELELLQTDSLWVEPAVKVKRPIKVQPEPNSEFPRQQVICSILIGLVAFVLFKNRIFRRD